MQSNLFLSRPIEILNLSDELLTTLHSFGIHTIEQFIRLQSKEIKYLGIDDNTASRLFREALIVSNGNIPSALLVYIEDVVMIDFRMIATSTTRRVWYVGAKSVNDEQYWIAKDGLSQEKYVLFSLSEWLSKHKDCEIILIRNSEFERLQLMKRLSFYGLGDFSRIADSVTWDEFCSMSVLWGHSSSYRNLLQYYKMDRSRKEPGFDLSELVSGNLDGGKIQGLVEHTREEFEIAKFIIKNLLMVY